MSDITKDMTEQEKQALAELGKTEQRPVKQYPGIHGYNAKELLNMRFPDIKYIVPDLLPEGLIIIAGRPKIGKSWLMMDLAVSVASGRMFLGNLKVIQGRVLYCALEDNERRLSSRLRLVLRGEEAPENLHLFTQWPRLDNNGCVMFEKFLQKYPDTRLIVIDTLAKIKAVRPQRSNNTIYSEDYSSVEPLKAIADKHGIGVLLVHHTRKLLGGDDKFEEISGSYGLTGGTDAMMVLTKDRARCDGVLYITGRDLQEKELALKWNDTTTSWSLLGNAVEYKMSLERQQIIEVLRNTNIPMSISAVSSELGKNKNTIKNTLNAMYKAGLISKTPDSKYSLPISININDSLNSPDSLCSLNSPDSPTQQTININSRTMEQIVYQNTDEIRPLKGMDYVDYTDHKNNKKNWWEGTDDDSFPF